MGRLESLVAAGTEDPRLREATHAVRAAALIAQQAIAEQSRRIRELESLSVTDELTGLFNRRGFQAELTRTLAQAARRGETGMLLLCDLDRFKAINDAYGHQAGDAALCMVAQLLRHGLRAGDVVARLGGDEFAMLMTGAGPQALRRRIRKLERTLSGILLDLGDVKVPLSASLGYSGYGPHSDPDVVFRLADRALYRSKKFQRDGV